MFDSTTLLPNLNEIMEEYTELENQIEQGSQAAAVQVDDREDENEKQQQKGKESRKIKKRADEARVEHIKEKARNFSFKKAAAIVEGSLKDKGFISERGLKKSYLSFYENVGK